MITKTDNGNAVPTLIMALEIESQGAFEELNVPVHYCGVGKVNAAYVATKLIHQGATAVLNLGTAGSHRLAPHTLVHCDRFVQRDMNLTPLGCPLGTTPMDPLPAILKGNTHDLGYTTGICGTGDTFEVGPPQLACDLVDMEAYALAKVCQREGVPFYCYKYITDSSDEAAHKEWRTHLKRASLALRECYLKFQASWNRK